MKINLPKFTQIMGECCSKEWVAKLPGYCDDTDEALWVLLRVTNLSEVAEEGLFMAELYESASDVNWLDRSIQPLELLVDQFFCGQYPTWSSSGTNPIALMHEAVKFVSLTY